MGIIRKAESSGLSFTLCSPISNFLFISRFHQRHIIYSSSSKSVPALTLNISSSAFHTREKVFAQSRGFFLGGGGGGRGLGNIKS